ncbi:uncharacterized protein [Penaeus vannamei]|nr:cubilin-like [Penaeus vannamei]
MMLHLVVAAAMAVASSRAWPISPLENYLRGEAEHHNVTCGDDFKIWVDKDPLILTFVGTSPDGSIPAGCTADIRIDENDRHLEKYGLQFSGAVDLRDADNVDDKCTSSSLTVTDMDSDEDETGTKAVTCGQKPVTYHTTQDSTNVQLRVGPNGAEGNGFSLTVTPHYVCGGTVDANTYIESPDFPQPYPSDTDCFWYIKGEQIELEFEEFDLHPKKCNDHVFIQPMKGATEKLCEQPNKAKKYDGPIFVNFRSSKRSQNENKGFRCKVTIKSSKKRLSTLLSKFYEK